MRKVRTSRRHLQAEQARKGFRPPSAMKGIGYFQNLGNFWVFLENLWESLWKYFGIHFGIWKKKDRLQQGIINWWAYLREISRIGIIPNINVWNLSIILGMESSFDTYWTKKVVLSIARKKSEKKLWNNSIKKLMEGMLTIWFMIEL